MVIFCTRINDVTTLLLVLQHHVLLVLVHVDHIWVVLELLELLKLLRLVLMRVLMVQTLSQLELKAGFLRIGISIDFETQMSRYGSIFVL